MFKKESKKNISALLFHNMDWAVFLTLLALNCTGHHVHIWIAAQGNKPARPFSSIGAWWPQLPRALPKTDTRDPIWILGPVGSKKIDLI